MPCEWVLLLDADALQTAQGLTHSLDFLFAGLLLAHGLANVISELGQAVDGFTEPALDRLDLYQGGFQGGFGFFFAGWCLSGWRAGAVGS